MFHDYLLTNELLLPSFAGVFEKFVDAGGDPALLEPVLGVRQQYLEVSLATMREQYGTVERYFSDGLGLDAGVQTLLRERMIAD